MIRRERLPNRRHAETFDIEAGGLSYTATLGHYPDDRIDEILLRNHKPNSMASNAAVAASLALQHGVQIETLRKQ